MLDGISYLHETAGVAHRDLKPENLLLNSNFQLKIADFGLSVRQYNTATHRSAVGTRRYQAPEIIEGRRYSGAQTDIFSMGVILFLMVSGTMPYREKASLQDDFYYPLCVLDSESFFSNFDERECRKPDLPDEREQTILHEVKELMFTLLMGFALFM